jgi:hypothetical protein
MVGHHLWIAMQWEDLPKAEEISNFAVACLARDAGYFDD